MKEKLKAMGNKVKGWSMFCAIYALATILISGFMFVLGCGFGSDYGYEKGKEWGGAAMDGYKAGTEDQDRRNRAW